MTQPAETDREWRRQHLAAQVEAADAVLAELRSDGSGANEARIERLCRLRAKAHAELVELEGAGVLVLIAAVFTA